MNIPHHEQNALLDGPPPPPEWPDAIQLKITWLEQARLPETFTLGPSSRVKSSASYRDYLLVALEAGPGSALGRSAAYWLDALYQQFGDAAVHD